MRFYKSFIFLFVFNLSWVFGQQIQFVQSYSYQLSNVAPVDMCASINNSCFAASRTNIDPPYLVSYFDSTGQEMWTKSFTLNASNYVIHSVSALSDSSVLVCSDNLSIIKLNTLGDTIWTRTILNGCSSVSAKALNNGEFLIFGRDIFWNSSICKFDSTGAIQWQRHYFYSGYTLKIDFIEPTSNGFIASGSLDNDVDSTCIFIMKINAAGTVEWTNAFFSPSYVYSPVCTGLEITNNGTIVGAADFDPLKLFTLDSTGQFLRICDFGSIRINYYPRKPRNLIEAANGNYYFFNSTVYNNCYLYTQIMELDPQFNVLSKTAAHFIGHRLENCIDGGFFIHGGGRFCGSDPDDVSPAVIYKVDEHLNSSFCFQQIPADSASDVFPNTLRVPIGDSLGTCTITTANIGVVAQSLDCYNTCPDLVAFIPQNRQQENIEVYPNPSNGTITIRTELNSGKLKIKDVKGQTVFEHDLCLNIEQINLQPLPKGIYYYHISNNEVWYSGKLLLQ
jgi:hypothetical protein